VALGTITQVDDLYFSVLKDFKLKEEIDNPIEYTKKGRDIEFKSRSPK
jgi:hypothetical protein